MPGSKKGRKGKILVDISTLSLREIVHPYQDAGQNKRAREHVLSKLAERSPHRLPNQIKLHVHTKITGMEGVDDYLMTVYRETFQPSTVAVPEDEKDEGSKDVLWNGYRLNELHPKQHLEIILRLRKQIKKERQLCGTYAEEKKMFLQELLLSQNLLSKSQKQLLSANLEIGQEKEESRNNLMVSKQKLKHLMSEHYTTSYMAKTEVLGATVPTFTEAWKKEKVAYEVLMQIKQKEVIDRTVLDHLLREVQLSRVKENQINREEFLAIQEIMAETFMNFVEETRKETEESLKERLLSLDDKKNRQMNHMLEVQAKSLNNLRNYYQNIVSSNAEMICDLREQVNSRRAQLERLERSIYRALEELNRYQGPLQIIKDEILKCDRTLERAKVIREHFAKKHVRRRLLADDVKRYRWMKEIQSTRIEKGRDQLEKLNKAYFQTKFEIFRKSTLSNLLHSKALNLLSDEAAVYELSYHIVQGMSTDKPTASLESKNALQALLDEQTKEIDRLQTRGLFVKKKHDETWTLVRRVFEATMKSTMSNFGFYQPDFNDVFPRNMLLFNDRLPAQTFNVLEPLNPKRTEQLSTSSSTDVLQRVKCLRFDKTERLFKSMDEFIPTNVVKASMPYDLYAVDKQIDR